MLKDLEVSVQTLVSPVWKKLLEDKENIHLKAEAILREKKAEVATCQRKIEWKMSGTSTIFIFSSHGRSSENKSQSLKVKVEH